MFVAVIEMFNEFLLIFSSKTLNKSLNIVAAEFDLAFFVSISNEKL